MAGHPPVATNGQIVLAPGSSFSFSTTVDNQPPAATAGQIVSDPSAVLAPPPPPRGASIEERLDRLERMVQTLLTQQGRRHPRADVLTLAPEAENQPSKAKKDDAVAQPKDWKDQWFDPKEMELLRDRVKREVAPAIDQALREAARATEQAKRAYEQAQRAAKQAAEQFRRAEQNEHAQDYNQGHDPFNGNLAALQSQRDALERELQTLARQIEKLKKDREQSADAHPPGDPNNAAQPKPESSPSDTPSAK